MSKLIHITCGTWGNDGDTDYTMYGLDEDGKIYRRNDRIGRWELWDYGNLPDDDDEEQSQGVDLGEGEG